jgi:predicted RNA binding protein YcfA (HicA-like mRNA interferase family)
MSKIDKLILKILKGTSDSNIRFDDLCKVLDHFGFQNRLKGSHHIYYRYDVSEIINIQPKGGLSKSYQVKQIRDILMKYNIIEKEND